MDTYFWINIFKGYHSQNPNTEISNLFKMATLESMIVDDKEPEKPIDREKVNTLLATIFLDVRKKKQIFNFIHYKELPRLRTLILSRDSHIQFKPV